MQTELSPPPLASETPHSGRIEIYDTTLRDGTQGEGVSLSLADKLHIARKLDDLGFDYIEGGYPLSNPKDAAFFAEARTLRLVHARLCAFGMTRRKGLHPADDPGMKALVQSQAPVITIVGKTWDLHVSDVLGVSLQENLDMIRDSLAHCRQAGREVFYDAEHFFDGYRANPDYALATLRAAVEGGASRLILCDTNGGSLPGWVERCVSDVRHHFGSAAAPTAAPPHPTPLLGIHTHNDSGLAVANSLAAVEAGCVQVQGTINGLGERCGNVDLTTVIANLSLKMNRPCLRPGMTRRLTELSRYVYELANLAMASNQPFVGRSAFAHKGGMHVHAVNKLARSYEHVQPESVGNERRVLVSELSGVSNVAATLGRKFHIEHDRELQRRLVARVAELENQGYQFEAANASFELLLHELLDQRPHYWSLDHYRCVILKRDRERPTTEAIVKLTVAGRLEHQVAEGDGPVNALDAALRKCLAPHYPEIDRVHLTDFKVRVVNPTAESAAKVRVISEFTTPTRVFATVGVSENIVEASWQAIADALVYHLIETRTPAPPASHP